MARVYAQPCAWGRLVWTAARSPPEGRGRLKIAAHVCCQYVAIQSPFTTTHVVYFTGQDHRSCSRAPLAPTTCGARSGKSAKITGTVHVLMSCLWIAVAATVAARPELTATATASMHLE